jgi:hypothetical protein
MRLPPKLSPPATLGVDESISPNLNAPPPYLVGLSPLLLALSIPCDLPSNWLYFAFSSYSFSCLIANK